MSEVKSVPDTAMTLGVLGGVLLALSTTVPSLPLSLGVALFPSPSKSGGGRQKKGVPAWLAALCTVGGSVGWILVACAVAKAAGSGSDDDDDGSAYWSAAVVLGVFLAMCRGFLSRKWLREASRLAARRRKHQQPGDEVEEEEDDDDDSDDASETESGMGASRRTFHRQGRRRSPDRRVQASPYQSVFVVFALYILCAAGLGVLSALTTSDRCLVVSRVLLLSTIPVAEVVAAAPWAARGTDRLVSIAPVVLVLSLLTTTVVNIE